MLTIFKTNMSDVCRSPFGLRGLKCGEVNAIYEVPRRSQPIRAAWIEIPMPGKAAKDGSVAAHSGCVD